MESFMSRIFYVWKHVQYYTKYQVMIVTQFLFIVRFTIITKGNGYIIMYNRRNYLVFNSKLLVCATSVPGTSIPQYQHFWVGTI